MVKDMTEEKYSDYARCPKCEYGEAYADLGLGTISCPECGYRTLEGEVDL
jgi:DNA-directed RNA polymerase subunit RPC12/RpoP